MRRPATLLALLAALALGAAAIRVARPPRSPELAARLAVTSALGGEDAGFARADRPRAFSFPADHAAHDGFRTEWWYVTGNLVDDAGRVYGYQLTFFRRALAPVLAASPSNWRTAHVWMAHFALTDVTGGRFRAAESFGREALGLAGAAADPFRVHVGSWEMTAPGRELVPLRLRAAEGDDALDLELAPTRPPLLQGDEGLSRKGPEPGNASYYYSLPRLATRGTLTLAGRPVAVTGLSWLDREWSTSALPHDVVGWDWLALHLDDGSDLMLYRLRRADGTAAPESAGTLARADGSRARLAAGEFTMTPLGAWTSPRGTSYPARWRVSLPGLVLDVEPQLADQELDLSLRYWEGAVSARGQLAGAAISGSGYLEMTGYSGRRSITDAGAR